MKTQDKYSNKFYGTCTETAANTLTFAEIQTNVNIFDKVAWVLARLEWYLPPATRALFAATDDIITCALTSSNTISSLGLDSPSVIDLFEFAGILSTAVGFETMMSPIVRDFSTLPGGGIIMAPRPLYVALKGTSVASAATARVRGYFTMKELSADEYLELVDFYRIVS